MANRDTVPGVAKRLRDAREAAGMTQQEAADASGVHAVSIARFETDARSPTLASLIKLAAAYGVTTCSLIPGGETPPPKRGRKPKGKKEGGS